MNSELILYFLVLPSVGFILGCTSLWIYQRIKLTHFKQLASDIIKRAESESEVMKKEAQITMRHQQMEHQKEFERKLLQERKALQTEEDRIKQREDRLESRMNLVEKKLIDVEKREAAYLNKKTELELLEKNYQERHENLIHSIEKTAHFNAAEAKEYLINHVQEEIQQEAARLVKRTLKDANDTAELKATKIITTAINRLAVNCTSEATTNTVSIPNDEMKGRIIGKEGRNIRTLEQATGVNFLIDETPNTVTLSGFDPVRMQIAKLTLEELVQDGRIHPTRIEEAVDKARVNVHKLIKKYGEDAALRIGAINMHPELIQLLGKLKFRMSYGQNILDHSLEVAHLLGMMAAELGLDPRLAKRIGLLHDVGKAVSHEVEGSHAIIGYELALRFGESKEVANGIGCHHGEMEPTTIEASLCSAADAISSSRQGARSEPVEEYIKRLKRLEDLAMECPGVEKAYALQAGRELRVVVTPDLLNDDQTLNLARDLTRRIEQELKYPGKIKITVTRETRIVEYAM